MKEPCNERTNKSPQSNLQCEDYNGGKKDYIYCMFKIFFPSTILT